MTQEFLPHLSSFINWPRVGLCFSEDPALFRLLGTTASGRGAPIRSRASAFTAVTARNGLGFFFLAKAFSPVGQSVPSAPARLPIKTL